MQGLEYLPYLTTWPRSSLPLLQGLISFRLCPPNTKQWLPNLRPSIEDLALLPRGLATLELNFVDGLYDDSVAVLPAGLTSLLLPRNTMISNAGLSRLPKLITELNLASNFKIDSAHLPRQVVTFTGNLAAFPPQNDVVEGFPPTLTNLHLFAREELHAKKSRWTWESLPLLSALPALAELKMTLIKQEVQESYKEFKLPPTLTSLEVRGDVGPFKRYQDLHVLPPGLVSISLKFQERVLFAWSDEDFMSLPRTLTCVNLLNAYNQFRAVNPGAGVTLNHLQYLPPFLKTYHIFPIEIPDNIKQQVMAVGVSQRHKKMYEMWAQFALFLPHSLTSLRLCLSEKVPYRYPPMELLPPNIRFFSAYTQELSHGTSQEEENNVKLRKPLPPKNLHALSLAFSHRQIFPVQTLHIELSGRDATKNLDNWPLEQYCPNLQYFDSYWLKDMLKRLPPTLTWVSLHEQGSNDTTLTDKDILDLPDGVRTLQIRKANMLTDQCLPALPHDLTSLHLSSNQVTGTLFPFPSKLMSLSLGQRVDASRDSTYLLKLPPYLTELALSNPNTVNETLMDLPKHLTSLCLIETTRLTGEMLKHLPNTLLKLDVHNVDMNDYDVISLPRALRYFYNLRGAAGVSDDSAADWPPMLEILQIASTLMTDRSFCALPRSLTILTLQACMPLSVPIEVAVRSLGPRIRQVTIGSGAAYSFWDAAHKPLLAWMEKANWPIL